MPMTETPPETPRRGDRWLRRALIASLAGNLLVVGLVAGVILREGPPHRSPPGDPSFPYIHALTEAQRDEMRDALRADWRADREARQRDGADDEGERTRRGPLRDYDRAIEALRADPFDRDALAAILADQNSRAETWRARGQTVLLRYVEGMSPEARADYAARLAEDVEERRARFERFRERHRD